MINLLITLGYHVFYTIFIIVYLGYVDSSYSDTFYKLDGGMKLLFWGWILAISLPPAYYLRRKSIFATFGAIILIGVLICSYTVGESKMMYIHVISATGAIILMLLGFAIELSNWRKWNIFNYTVILMVIECIVILPIGSIKQGIPNHTFFIEMFMIITPVVALIINELIKKRKEIINGG